MNVRERHAVRKYPAATKIFTYRNGLMKQPLRMRLPTDKEIAALEMRQGRVDGEKERKVMALELVEGLAEGACALQPGEAAWLLNDVTRCEAVKTEWRGGVEMEARCYADVRTWHWFRLPTLDDITGFDSGAARAAEEFYGRLLVRAEGYSDAVPIYHKGVLGTALYASAAVKAMALESDDFFDEEPISDATTGAAPAAG